MQRDHLSPALSPKGGEGEGSGRARVGPLAGVLVYRWRAVVARKLNGVGVSLAGIGQVLKCSKGQARGLVARGNYLFRQNERNERNLNSEGGKAQG